MSICASSSDSLKAWLLSRSDFICCPAKYKQRFKERTHSKVYHLPFVKKDKSKPLGRSYWAVPKRGGYTGGCLTGKALARIYLKHLRQHGSEDHQGWLQVVVLDMFDIDDEETLEKDSFCGQIVGFFSELDQWLETATRNLGEDLDKVDNASLLKTANNGLNFDNQAFFESLPEKLKYSIPWEEYCQQKSTKFCVLYIWNGKERQSPWLKSARLAKAVQKFAQLLGLHATVYVD